MKVPVERVRAQIAAILGAWGMSERLLRVAVEAMVETDLAGVDSHGISMLVDYETSRARGKLDLKAQPRVVREGPVTARVDAGAGLGHPAAARAMEIAISKAKAMGVGVVTVVNSHHFGAAGYYAAMAAKAGLVGMVTSATRTIGVVPTRAAVPALGTNPIAFAAPARRNRPFLLDMATATAAANRVRVHELNGEPIPAGWVLDAKGVAVTDPGAAMDSIFRRTEKHRGGGLTPLGGTEEMSSYKGYGLAMMAHILGGTLSGASFSPIRVRSQKPSDPDNLGHFLMALDPGAFRPEGEFEDDLDAAIDVLHAIESVDPALPVLVAGDPEAAAREVRLRDGIPIPRTLLNKLRGVCERCGAPFVLV